MNVHITLRKTAASQRGSGFPSAAASGIVIVDAIPDGYWYVANDGVTHAFVRSLDQMFSGKHATVIALQIAQAADARQTRAVGQTAVRSRPSRGSSFPLTPRSRALGARPGRV